MKIIPLRLRMQLVHAYTSGLVGSYNSAAEMFGVGRASVSRLLRQFRETGSLEPKPSGHRARAVDDAWLLEHAMNHPDALLRERVEAWTAHSGNSVHISTMADAMKRIGWTYKKKTPTAREANEPEVLEKVEAFKEKQSMLELGRLVFVDETGFRLGSSPRYGWARSGEDAVGHHVQRSWTTITLIGAIASDGFRGVMTINGGTSTDVMQAFVEQILTPNLNSGDIVVMDNLAAHRSKSVVDAIKKAGANVLFTPPYHPEFNPIEKTWGKLKDILRRWNTLTREAFDVAVAKAMKLITLSDIEGWTQHAGY